MGSDAKAAPETKLQLRVGDPGALSKCEDPEVSSGTPGERVLLQIAEQGGTRDGICGKSAGHRGGLPLGVHVITKPILLIRIGQLIRIDNRPIEQRTRYVTAPIAGKNTVLVPVRISRRAVPITVPWVPVPGTVILTI